MSRKKKQTKKAKINELKEVSVVVETPHDLQVDQRTPAPEMQRKISSLVWVLIAIVSIILIYERVISWEESELVSDSKRIVFFVDNDSCYHARRILYIAQHHMKLPFYDPLIAHPEGAVPIWSPLHDWLYALPSFIIGLGSPSDYLVLRTATIINVIFGLLQVLIYGLLIKKAANKIYLAILAALFIGIAAPQASFTRISFLDHNTTLLLIFSVLLYKLFIIFSREAPLRLLKDLALIALLVAMLFWSWPGSYLYIGPLILIQLLYVLLSRKSWMCNSFASSYMISAALVLPLAVYHYRFNKEVFKFEYVSFFTVLFLIAGGLLFYGLSNIYALKSATASRYAVFKLCAAAAGIAVIAYLLIPSMLAGVEYAAAQNKWLSTIVESQPLLFFVSGEFTKFTLNKLIYGLGYLALLYPLVYYLLLVKWIKVPLGLYSILVIIGAIFCVLALFQTKFLTEFSIPCGLLLSLFAGTCYEKLSRQGKESGGSVTVLAIIIIVIIIGLLPLRGIFAKPGFSVFKLAYPAFNFIKEVISPGEIPINSNLRSMNRKSDLPGIMTPWEYGHHLKLYGQIPTVADNFGYIYLDIGKWQGFYDMADFFTTIDEQHAIAILNKYKARYVFVSDSFVYENYLKFIDKDYRDYFRYWEELVNGKMELMNRPKPLFLETVGFRLSELYGSALPYGPDVGNTQQFNALKHFRLLYELPSFVESGKKLPPGRVKIYKVVKGAELKIPADGDSSYVLEAIIKSNSGKDFFYRQKGFLKDKIIVPYPTFSSGKFPYAVSYKVIADGLLYEFNNITESAID